MASPTPPSSNTPTPRPPLIDVLARNQQVVGVVLLIAAAAFAAVSITMVVRATIAKAPADAAKPAEPDAITPAAEVGKPSWADGMGPTFFWGVACALVCTTIGLLCLLPATRQKLAETDRMRLMLLVLGGSLGILTALLGMTLPFTRHFAPIIVGGAEEWRKNKLELLGVALALIGGFAVAFASLQLARGVERENALMRRLLYGFSTGFTALLLVAVLLLINLLPYLGRYDPLPFLNATYDWTQSRLYSLSDRSRAALAGLKEPLKAYVFLDSNDPVGDEVITMLRNCQAVTPQVSYETISSLNKSRVQELVKQYQEKIVEEDVDAMGRRVFAARPGVLLVYGEAPKEKAAFLPRESMTKEDFGEGTAGREIFLGEAVLMKAVRSLAEGKLVIYFTQGDGEMDFNGRKRDDLLLIQEAMKGRESYDLKQLTFGPNATEVPKDADVVVVARPDQLKPDALKALGEYMGYAYSDVDGSFRDIPKGRKGRLCVLMGVNVANKQMVHSKLEPLLEKLGVKVEDDRILSLEEPGAPTVVEVETNAASANKVAKAFGPPNRTVFLFDDVRPVRPAPEGGPFVVEALAQTADPRVWVETNAGAPPTALAAAHANDPNARFSPSPIPVAVAVSERAEVPNDQFHAAVSAPGGPRLVVFGNASWISNVEMNESSNFDRNYSLLTSCLSWLRGDPDIGVAPQDVDENKVRPKFDMNLSIAGYWATVLLPATHMLLAVMAAGLGVWLVRRR